MRYRILHCLPSLHIGGVFRSLLARLEHFNHDCFSHFVVVITDHDRDLALHLATLGIDPVFLGHRHRAHFPLTTLRLARFCRRNRVDLLHTHLLLDRICGGMAAVLTGLPVVTSLHTMASPPQGSFLHTLEDVVSRATSRRFLAVSEAVSRFHQEHRAMPPDKIEVLYPGISVDGLRKRRRSSTLESLRADLRLEDAHPLLIHVGRLAQEKGQRYLLPALRRVRRVHPQARLLLVGEGQERPALYEEAHHEGVADAVRFTGMRSDVEDLLHLGDVFLFPSNPGEGLGVALLEAMAAGLPVVASALPSLSEVVQNHQNGLLVKPRNPEAIATAILELFAAPDRRIEMAHNAQRTIGKSFDALKSTRRLEEIYREILEGGS